MNDFKLLLIQLNDFNPFRPSHAKSRLDLLAEKVPLLFFKTAIGLFLVLLILIGWHLFISPFTQGWKTFALGIATLTLVAELLFLISTIIFSAIQTLGLKKQTFSWLLQEAETDFQYACLVLRFDLDTINEVRCWLVVKCMRMENRIKLFMGNPEVLAAPAILVFVFSAQDFLSRQPKTTSFTMPIILVSATVVGFAIGAIFLNILIQKYRYQIEVLDMAVRLKAKNETA